VWPLKLVRRPSIQLMTANHKEKNMKARTNFLKTGLFTLFVLAVATLMLMVAGAKAAAPPDRADDRADDQAALSKKVGHELAMLPRYGVFDNLQYSIEGSEVILSGQVVEPVTKLDAETALKGLPGVTHIVNDITVLPLSQFDNQIRRAEFRAIFSAPTLSRYSMGTIPTIHIIVGNGHVTLDGLVSNDMDRNIATMRAQSVPGVFSVTNNLQIG
jgi:hyperosmotically inducible protein